MPIIYSRLTSLLLSFALLCSISLAVARPKIVPSNPTKAPREVPVLLTKVATVVEYKQPRLRVDIKDDPSEYYSYIDLSDSTLIFASKEDRTSFENNREQLERDSQREEERRLKGRAKGQRVKAASGRPPYMMPYLTNRNLLRTGVEVEITFLEYRYSRRFIMQTVTILTDMAGNGTVTGTFEQLTGDVASISGQPVRLKAGSFLMGDKGYKSLRFNALSKLEEGMEVTVQGKRQPDGVLLAESGTVVPDEITDADQQIIQVLKLTQQLSPDGSQLSFGTRQYPILRDESINGYITKLGRKLMPNSLKNLPQDHPSYIGFRFFVITDSTANVCAYPDGSVYVHTGLLTTLDNEAQLAAMMSRELAHVAFHHARRMYQRSQKENAGKTTVSPTMAAAFGMEPADLTVYATAFGGGPLSSNYNKELESQADRLGLNYMMTAGYDPRETPVVWNKLYQENPDMPSVPFGSRLVGPNGQTIASPYASHASAGRRYKYINFLLIRRLQGVDLNKFTKGEATFKAMQKHLLELLNPTPEEPETRPKPDLRPAEPSRPIVRRPRPISSAPAKKQ